MEKHANLRIETTLGDLIAAAGEVAFEYSDNDRDGFELARFTLIELLKKTSHPADLNKEFAALPCPSSLMH